MMIIQNKILMGLAALFATGFAGAAQAQSENYVGEIQMFGGNYCPRGTAAASGQTLPINSNAALYSLLGIAYGGDGRVNFALPNLQGTAPIGVGPSNPLGQAGGSATVTLTAANLPLHNHVGVVEASTAGPATATVAGGVLATFPANAPIYDNAVAPNAAMAAGSATAQPAGGNQPVSVMYPYQVMRACIVTNGLYPSRP